MPEIIKCEFCGNSRPATLSKCPYCKPTKQQILNSKINKTAEAVAKTVEERRERQDRQQRAYAAVTTNLPPGEPEIEIESKYTAMTTISLLIKGLAVLVFAAGGFGMFTDTPFTTRFIGLSSATFASILTWAYSEFIDIGINIERNQRKLIKILINK